MQYILSESEYTALRAAVERKHEDLTAIIQDLCIRVAKNQLVRPTDGEDQTPRPHGCGMSTPDGLDGLNCWGCPVLRTCPYEFKKFRK